VPGSENETGVEDVVHATLREIADTVVQLPGQPQEVVLHPIPRRTATPSRIVR
jgi:hypothetical protein